MNGNPADYDLVTAGTLGEALMHVAAGRRPIAGGTDLMVLFEAGRLPFRKLVGIRAVPELRRIDVSGEHIDIGAGVTFSDIRKHPDLERECGLLVQAASWTGGIANQNRGTLGGNIVNASPAADSAPALLAYDTEVEVASLRGMRWMDYAAYHTGYKKMRMEPDELLTRIRIPRPHGKWIEYGRKVGARKAQAISKLSVAARAKMDGRQVSDVRIAFASVAPMPLRCVETERALTAKVLSAETRQRAREALAAELSPIDDIRSTAEYRRRVAINLLDGFMDLLAPVRDMISHWNQLPAPAAEEQIRKCCGSARWAQQIASERPFAAPEHLISAADRVWAGLDLEDRLEAFRAHPRIGAVAPTKWAAYEQSGMSAAGGHVRQALESGNVEYESRFGFIYIVCATGKSAEEMLDLLQQRLRNSRETEIEEASEQQRQIMQLRLRKWLAE